MPWEQNNDWVWANNLTTGSPDEWHQVLDPTGLYQLFRYSQYHIIFQMYPEGDRLRNRSSIQNWWMSLFVIQSTIVENGYLKQPCSLCMVLSKVVATSLLMVTTCSEVMGISKIETDDWTGQPILIRQNCQRLCVRACMCAATKQNIMESNYLHIWKQQPSKYWPRLLRAIKDWVQDFCIKMSNFETQYLRFSTCYEFESKFI